MYNMYTRAGAHTHTQTNNCSTPPRTDNTCCTRTGFYNTHTHTQLHTWWNNHFMHTEQQAQTQAQTKSHKTGLQLKINELWRTLMHGGWGGGVGLRNVQMEGTHLMKCKYTSWLRQRRGVHRRYRQGEGERKDHSFELLLLLEPKQYSLSSWSISNNDNRSMRFLFLSPWQLWGHEVRRYKGWHQGGAE